ncbi:hypothetical protein F5Y03DRAFT_321328 [Xylaria venustula]|nr:hypothetical protein F5Y03DRAFT_321328 [Xylaria venustula]
MAPNYPRNSYIDDRRSSGAHREPYRSGADRPPPARRDSRDGRYNESREIRSPHESRASHERRRDNETSRPHADTNFRPPEGPKRMSNHSPSDLPDRPSEGSNRVLNNSPAGLPDKPGGGLHFRRINTDKNVTINNSADGSSVTPSMPKASNPKLQEAFENAYNWGEKSNKRLLLSIRRSKIAQETTQRRTETEKYLQKAPIFPPYVGQGDNFTGIDRALDDECKVADDEYFRVLEQLVACFATTSEPAATNCQDPVIAALEAKVEEVSQIAANLLEENKKYSALKSDYDELQLKFRAVDDKIHVLESRQVIMDTENKGLKQQLEDLQSNTDKEIKSSSAQLAKSIKQSSDALDAQGLFEIRAEKRFRDVETKLARFTDYDEIKEKVEDLDVNTLNDVSEAWVDNMKSQYNDYKERRRPNDPSIYETIHSLRQKLDSLQVSQKNVPQSNETVLSMDAIEAAINTNLKMFEENLNKAIIGRDDLISGMIDNAATRISSLEERESGYAKLAKRIELLEQWSVKCSDWMDKNEGLAERVTNLEGKRLGHRVDRIDLNVGGLSQKLEALESDVAQLVKPEWVEHRLQQVLVNTGINASLADNVKDYQRRLLAIELAIKTLDSQFQNISTKQLAEHIVRLTNPVFEQRLGKVEAKANQLEVKANGSDKTVNRHTEQLNTFESALASFTNRLKTSEKRTGSPGDPDDSNKRRKLEVNGRLPNALQQQRRDPSS